VVQPGRPGLSLAFHVGMRILTCCTALLLVFLQAQGATAQSPTGSVSGAVSLPEPDGQPVVVPGVTLSLACDGMEPRSDVSNELGQFHFADVRAGACSVVAELQGFKSAVKAVAVKPGETADVALRLDLEALHEEVNVTGSADTVDGGPSRADHGQRDADGADRERTVSGRTPAHSRRRSRAGRAAQYQRHTQ
jgi:hypothetical protein